MSEQTYTVTGMTCDHCVRAVTEELQKLPGVTGVEIELSTGQVTIHAEQDLDGSAVEAAVDEAGYEMAT